MPKPRAHLELSKAVRHRPGLSVRSASSQPGAQLLCEQLRKLVFLHVLHQKVCARRVGGVGSRNVCVGEGIELVQTRQTPTGECSKTAARVFTYDGRSSRRADRNGRGETLRSGRVLLLCLILAMNPNHRRRRPARRDVWWHVHTHKKKNKEKNRAKASNSSRGRKKNVSNPVCCLVVANRAPCTVEV